MAKTQPITEASMSPRLAYAQKKSPAQIIVVGIDAIIILLALIFAIIPTVITATYSPDTGTVISQEAKHGGKRTIYNTTFEYNGEIIDSKDTSYKSVRDTGVTGDSIDLLVSNSGDIEITKAVKHSQTLAIAIFLLSSAFLIGTMFMGKRFKKVFTNNPSFTDSKAIAIMYSPKEWKSAFPQLADKINPETGNIDDNYQPPLYETTKEKEVRFNTTLEQHNRSQRSL